MFQKIKDFLNFIFGNYPPKLVRERSADPSIMTDDFNQHQIKAFGRPYQDFVEFTTATGTYGPTSMQWELSTIERFSVKKKRIFYSRRNSKLYRRKMSGN